MSEIYVTRIRTEFGDKQIDYRALANLPRCDETLSVAGGMADAKATGDRINELSERLTDDIGNLESTKADVTYVDTQIENLNSASTTYVDEQIENLNSASITYVNEQIENLNSASTTYVDEQIESLNSSNRTYVNEQLALKADKSTVDAMLTVPSSTASDNGKFLRVVNGSAAWITVPNAEESGF